MLGGKEGPGPAAVLDVVQALRKKINYKRRDDLIGEE